MRLGGSHVKSGARSYHYRSCDYSITIAFLFSVSSNKQVIVKSYLQLGKKPLNFMGKTRRKQVFLLIQKTF